MDLPLDAERARGVSDVELLAVFFRDKAVSILTGAGGSLRRVLEQPLPRNRVARRQLAAAMEIARRALLEEVRRTALGSPSEVRDYLRAHFAGCEVEHFAAVWLDAQNRVLIVENLFRGTLTQTSVYPREVARAAIKHNAAAVIFSHNHPSGTSEPSAADRTITTALKQALALIDVKVLDHFIVGGSAICSFAELGLL